MIFTCKEQELFYYWLTNILTPVYLKSKYEFGACKMKYKVREWGIVDEQMYINEQWFETLEEAREFANQTPAGTQADIHNVEQGLIETVKN